MRLVLCVSCWILTRVGYGSVLVFSVLDISSELASRVGYGSVLVFSVLDISSELVSRYPRFFVSQARVFVVLGVLSRYLCCTVEVCIVFLDTLTPEFELYVRLRERWQWGSDFPEFVLLSLVARLVLRRETLEVPGMNLQLCVCRCGIGWSPQLFDFFLVERQLDLSSVTARLRGCSCVVLSGLDTGLISQ
ncbi:hypothetical protein Taro_018035 [Colocasia esculenta]|uniref:Uncharacterized protein n=1 Tax=Colocasia esculenta TaxID=4460 RepID=A0A843UPQ8_COLES|nr:hypothetical protein [Colocasia esculenta]